MTGTAPPTNTETAYRYISGRISSGELSPGAYVNENGIAGVLGFNRAAVREAVNRLIAEGALEKRENRRAYVAQLGHDQADALRHFRAVIESGAAYFAAGARRDADIRAMRGFIEEHRFLVEREYWEGVATADERFHHRLVVASNNQMIVQAYERSKIKLRISMSPNVAQNEYERTLPEHEAVVKAIADRRAEDAQRLMWKHLMKKEGKQ